MTSVVQRGFAKSTKNQNLVRGQWTWMLTDIHVVPLPKNTMAFSFTRLVKWQKHSSLLLKTSSRKSKMDGMTRQSSVSCNWSGVLLHKRFKKTVLLPLKLNVNIFYLTIMVHIIMLVNDFLPTVYLNHRANQAAVTVYDPTCFVLWHSSRSLLM